MDRMFIGWDGLLRVLATFVLDSLCMYSFSGALTSVFTAENTRFNGMRLGASQNETWGKIPHHTRIICNGSRDKKTKLVLVV